ncbi:EamA family transporter [Agromyces humatus]|uniref:EamA domain-containing protein n=1 Tax=Agromyces humatus TaxID=279573 RepID=A0ABP4XCB8_9MICO
MATPSRASSTSEAAPASLEQDRVEFAFELLHLLRDRFLLVAVPLVFLVPKPNAPWRVIIGIGLFMSAGQFGLLFTAMHLGLPAGLAAVVLQCQMIFTLIIGALALRERPTRMQLVGALVGVIGLGVVALGRFEAAPWVAAVVPIARSVPPEPTRLPCCGVSIGACAGTSTPSTISNRPRRATRCTRRRCSTCAR